MRRFVLIGTLCALGLSSTAWAGTVEGRLALSNQTVAPTEGAPHYWNAWNGFIAAREPSVDYARELTVVLRGTGGEPVGCEYAIRGGALTPETMVVKAGEQVRVTNGDGASHELTFDGLEGGAALATPPGNARQIRVPSAGSHAIHDALYAHVTGTLVAIDDLVACATVESDGHYAFPEVEPGDYTLAVYRDGQQVHEQAVTVGSDKLDVPRIGLD